VRGGTRRLQRWIAAAAAFGVAAAAIPSLASAACCSIAKVDDETPVVPVRVCEPSAGETCGSVLFEGTIPLGGREPVCVSGETVRYQEWDPVAAAFAAPVDAVCGPEDVEL